MHAFDTVVDRALTRLTRTYARTHPLLDFDDDGDIEPAYTGTVDWGQGSLTQAATTGTVVLADELAD